ncbi:MAG: hypothetical protein ACRCVM_08900 [Giesbergeria sp.]|nr:hypothetical protein [Giesbergeria sp.]
MGIVLLATSVLPRPFMGLFRWWKSRRPYSMRSVASPAPRSCVAATVAHKPALISRTPRVWQGPVQAAVPPTSARPLRCHTSANGRMVIAGRMADVCAELERLAAHEQRH